MNKLLCISSIGFSIPLLYAFYLNQIFITCNGILVLISSLLHHFTNLENSIYHKIDIIISRSTCIILHIYVLYNTYDLLFCLYTFSYMYLTYYISCIQYKLSIIQNDNIWIYYHLYFHITVITSMILHIHKISNFQQFE
jgi:hypothetical protein